VAPPPDASAIAADERFDAAALVAALRAAGKEAFLWGQGAESPEQAAEAIAAQVSANAMPEDVVAVLSNGGFGGLHKKLLARLGARFGA
jgi:UDP-N-acetylmuramate: L-alanyl-gamma-D-glutamyl-meso-diaminopimelate ligase